MIKLSSLSCSFEKRTILDNISLSIESHLSILGANGSGKSTLAKSLCNLVEFQGEILIDNKNIKELSLKQRAKLISYIPAKLEAYDSRISVEEFVLLGRFPYKRSFLDYDQDDKKIAKECLEYLGISSLSTHPLNSLSSGESQLTLIAQALAQQSSIIIFDEPTANLDPKNSKIIAQHIKGLKEHCRVILITHDIALASFINSDIAFIKESQIYSYKEDFFKEETLSSLYEVSFDSLEVKYD